MGYLDRGNGPSLVACTVIPFVLTWTFASVRIYVRRFILKIWKVEDWLFLASQIFFSVLALCAFLATVYGNGQHLETVNAQDVPTVMKYWYASELISIVTSLLIRLSIGFFLLRICNLTMHLLIIRIAMCVMVTGSLLYFGFMVFQCHPVAYFWMEFNGGQGYCFPARTVADLTIVYSVLSALVDLLFGILPIFVVAKLMMDIRAKCVVGGLLTLGILAGLSVIIRIIYVHGLVDPRGDFTFVTFRVVIWSIIEPAIGIICMAITTYRPLFKSLRDKTSLYTSAKSQGINGPLNITKSHTGSKSLIKNFSTPTSSVTSPSPSYSPRLIRNLSRKNVLVRTRSTVSQSSSKFEDMMEKEGMQRQPSVTGGRESPGGDKDWEESFMMKDGIVRSTTVTVEVHRSDKQGGDMV